MGRDLFAVQPQKAAQPNATKGRDLFAVKPQQPQQQEALQNGLPNTAGVSLDTNQPLQASESTEQAQSSNMLQDVGNAIAEFAASGNRAAFDALDFLGPDNFNAISTLVGSDIRSPTFKGTLGSEGGFMEAGTARDVVQGLGQLAPVLGGAAPVVGRNLASAGGIAAEALGLGAAQITQPLKAGTELVAQAFPSKARQQAKIPLLRQAGEAKAAGFKLSDDGKVVKDAVQQSALKADIPADTVSFIATTNKATKKRLGQMVDVLVKGKENRRYREFNVPQQVIGEALDERLKVLQLTNRNAASKLDDVANSLEGQRVDVSAPIEAFKQNLAKQRISIDGKGNLIFKGSSIEGLGPPQKTIKNVYNRLRYTEDPTKNALRVHDAKKFIDEQVSYGKTQDGLSGNMEGIIKALRHDLDGVLDAKFSKYDEVNTAYSETRGVIDDLQSLVGKKVDLTGDDASRSLGTMSRKILTNYNTNQPVKEIIGKLDEFGRKYGTPMSASKMDDDIADLVTMESFLRETFARAAKSGSIEGIGRNVAGGAAEVATGNKLGLVSRGLRAAGEVFSPTDEAKLKALKDLMK
jgi:hypothetical protein